MESTTNSSFCSMESEDATASEESGWTAYLEDFSEKRREAAAAASTVSSSMVSDAASCAVAWKAVEGEARIGDLPKSLRKLNFKKRKTRRLMEDDSLEDTASSPVNSPKVVDLENAEANTIKKLGDHNIITQANGDNSDNHMELRRNGMDGLGFMQGAKECSDLRKKGLCLVPLSMLLDYLP